MCDCVGYVNYCIYFFIVSIFLWYQCYYLMMYVEILIASGSIRGSVSSDDLVDSLYLVVFVVMWVIHANMESGLNIWWNLDTNLYMGW